MLHHTDLLAHAHDRHRQLVAEADNYRLFKRARRRDRRDAVAKAPPEITPTRVTAGSPQPAGTSC